ncbi:hypothetical protein FGF95_21725 [Salmonella sp. fj-h1]|nr:hypothetical protein [Salmonella sp. fj-h1]
MSPRALSRIHRNGKSILGGPVDWDMTPLRQCSQRCSAGYGSGQASSSTGCSPYGLPFIGRSCGLCCEARCLSSGCFKELHFITTVRVLRRDSNPLPSSAISDVAKYPYLLCWCRLTDSNR